MAVPPAWSTLTVDERRALVLGADMVDVVAHLLDFDRNFVEDITRELDPTGGDVTWNGDLPITRDCDVILGRLLDAETELLKLYVDLSDSVAIKSARVPLGVFTMTAPDEALAETPVSYASKGQDRTYFLDEEVGHSVSFPAGASYLGAIKSVFDDAGLTGYRIDQAAAGKRLPKAMAWAWLPTSTDTSSGSPSTVSYPADSGLSADDDSGQVTRRRIINDLSKAIGYRAVHDDADGEYVCELYVDAAEQDPSFTFDAMSELVSSVGLDRTVSRQPALYNEFTFVNSTLPDVGGVPAVPKVGNGLYVVANSTGRRTRPTQVRLPAADQATLVKLGDAYAASALRTVETLAFTTVPYPAAGHFDVLEVLDDRLEVDGGWIVEVSEWRFPLDGGDTEWHATRVAA